MTNTQNSFGYWELVIIWSLEFGYWNLSHPVWWAELKAHFEL
jgi:hypothetical protein